MEAKTKLLAILIVFASILVSLNKTNAQSYTWSGSTGTPPCDELQSYHGTMAIMQGTGTGAGSALTALGVNTVTPAYMLDVSSPTSGDGVNVGGASYYNGYRISEKPVLFMYGSYYNVFVGYQSGNSSIINDQNTACGFGTGYSLTYGGDNTLVGANAGTSLTGSSMNGSYAWWNTMVGIDAGKYTDQGYSNNFYGKASGYNCQNGIRNCMYGSHAGFGNNGLYTADYNCFFGNWSAYNISGTGTAQANVIIGDSAGFNTGGIIPSSGGTSYSSNHNVFVGGFSAYKNPGGNYNITLGYGADAYGLSGTTPVTIQNAAAIGGDAIVNYDNEFILGNNAQSVGIGMIGRGFPLGKLEVFQYTGGTNTIGEFVTNTDLSSATTNSVTPQPLKGIEGYLPNPHAKNYYNVAGWFEADPYITVSTTNVLQQQYAIFVPGTWNAKWGYTSGDGGAVPNAQTRGTVDIGFPFNMDFPDYTLDVDGYARVLATIYPSDSTIKKNQTPFKYGIKAIRNLNPISYKYNGTGGFDTNGTFVGLTAQNLGRNVPAGLMYSRIVKDTTSATDTATIGNIYGEAVLYTAINAIKEVDSAATSNLGKQAQTNDSLRNGLYGNGWGLTGNAGTTPGTNFVGTTDAEALEFKTDAQKSGWIDYTAPGNTSLGYQAENSTTGQWNTSVGYQSMYSNTSGNYNTAFGFQALNANSTGNNNVAVGQRALTGSTGNDNTGVGNLALASNTSGTDNTAIGYQVLYVNNTGTFNTGIGDNTLYTNSSGNYNTGVGYNALYYNTGSNNTAVGKNSLLNTTGADNVALGTSAGGTNTTGTNNTFIGYGTDFAGGATNYTNSAALGNGTTITASNQVNIGNTSVSTIQGEVNFSTYSDRRIKTNIQQNVPGLTFINKLQPVTYNLNIHQQDNIMGVTDSTSLNNTDYWAHKYDIESIVFSGLIAQQVDTAAIQCGYNFSGVKMPTTSNGLYGLSYSDFVVPLIKSVQQLSASKDSMHSTIDSLRSTLDSLRNAFKNIQSCLTQLCANGGHSAIHHTGGSGNSDSNATITNTQDVTLSALANAPLLYQNIPNPFNTATKINYYLPVGTQGAIIVFYDSYGNKLKEVQLSQTGNGTLNITPDNLTSGIYSYSLIVNGNVIDTKRMLLQK